MLVIRNFSKNYDNHHVLAIPELTLAPGLYWIQGANGSGKTSLFKSLAGILPHNGSIELDGVSLDHQPVAYRLLVNYSEAEPLYPGFLTAKDLIRFIGKTRRATRAQQDALVSTWGVDSFLDQPTGTYSSGMLKKLSLLLTFLGNSKLVILDEPFITLDNTARDLLFGNIRKKMEDAIVLISSHQSFEESGLPVNRSFYIEHKTLIAVERSSFHSK